MIDADGLDPALLEKLGPAIAAFRANAANRSPAGPSGAPANIRFLSLAEETMSAVAVVVLLPYLVAALFLVDSSESECSCSGALSASFSSGVESLWGRSSDCSSVFCSCSC